MTQPCSDLARRLGDPMAGTASVLGTFVLLEHPGAWAADAVPRTFAALLDGDPLGELARLYTERRFRALLVRRPGRSGRPPDREPVAFVGSTVPGDERLETLPARELRPELLEAVAEGDSGIGDPVTGPLFAVCTNGSVDRCCAVRGRPLVAALAERYPQETWEVSHLGGCQFAANLLVLPTGALHGALTPEAGLGVADAAQRGAITPTALRGRTAAPALASTAEVGLRRRLGLLDDDAVEILAERAHPDRVEGYAGPEPAGADVWLRVGDDCWRGSVRLEDRGERTSVCVGTVRALAPRLIRLHRVSRGTSGPGDVPPGRVEDPADPGEPAVPACPADPGDPADPAGQGEPAVRGGDRSLEARRTPA